MEVILQSAIETNLELKKKFEEEYKKPLHAINLFTFEASKFVCVECGGKIDKWILAFYDNDVTRVLCFNCQNK